MRRLKLTGMRFGKLIVRSFAGIKGKHTAWNCLCDCGKMTVVSSKHLREKQKNPLSGCQKCYRLYRKNGTIEGCRNCGKEFYCKAYRKIDAKILGVFCSQKCHNVINGKHFTGHRNYFSKDFIVWNKGKKGLQVAWNKGLAGDKQPNWIFDRSQLKKSENRLHDTQYNYWSRDVKKRDKWKCRIADENCGGRMEAHHILCWKDFPELRYSLTNGITLCHAHHPRKRAEEKRLSPYFTELVSVSKI